MWEILKTGSFDSLTNPSSRSLSHFIYLAPGGVTLGTSTSEGKRVRARGEACSARVQSVGCSNVGCTWTICKGRALSAAAGGLISSDIHSVHHCTGGHSAQAQGSPPGPLLSHGPKGRATEPALRESIPTPLWSGWDFSGSGCIHRWGGRMETGHLMVAFRGDVRTESLT